MIYDLIIIGMGPAGMAAAIYAKRGGLNVLLLEGKMPGGLLNTTNVIENYPGFSRIDGPTLAFEMLNHIKKLEIKYINEDVSKIDDGSVKKVITKKNTYEAKNILIATGRTRRKLGINGEEEYIGKGVSYCAICDAPFFKEKDVVVIGAGNSSLEESIYLSNIVKSVTIIVRKDYVRAQQELLDKVNSIDNIEILYQKNVKEIVGNETQVEGVILDDGRKLQTSGVFIYIGFEPVIPFQINVKLNEENGYLLVDENMRTNIKGIYAAGDIIKKQLYQIITAESEGAIAATDVIKNIDKV